MFEEKRLDDLLYEFARAFKLTYMAIQYALLHRPTRFVVSGPAIPDELHT